jgi:hypothetical protein
VTPEKLLQIANNCAFMPPKDVFITSSVGTLSKIDVSQCKVLSEPLLINHLVLFFRKNHFLVETVDDKIGIFKAAGLNDFWISKYGNKKKPIWIDNGPKVITLHTISGTCKLLLYGLILALISFIIEKVLHKKCFH